MHPAKTAHTIVCAALMAFRAADVTSMGSRSRMNQPRSMWYQDLSSRKGTLPDARRRRDSCNRTDEPLPLPVLGNPAVIAGDGRRRRLCWPYADAKISSFHE